MTRTYVHRHRVTFEETNFTGNAYFAHYVRWQGHCREAFLSEHCPRVLDMLHDGYALVTVSCGVDYLRECWPLDLIEMHMSLCDTTTNRLTMIFDYQRVADAGPELAARGRQTVAFMRRRSTGLEPAPLPAQLIAALGPYMKRAGTHSPMPSTAME
ncbi:acyl-CoA thioesterase [Actinomadura sp. ATCC 39365]|uniref:acyl-CoA thioesterase n=1 Tax=Nonomuraea sp. NPDC005692 TaxID=3157168 RepID=UPI0033D477A9